MFDSIAKSFTNDPDATYDSTTSTTFENLFACSIDDPTDDLREVSHAVWQGFVEYSQSQVTIEISDDGSGLVEVSDLWGARCEDPSRTVQCDLPDTFYQECEGGCNPQTLRFELPDMYNVELDIPILEPCNFLSNLLFRSYTLSLIERASCRERV